MKSRPAPLSVKIRREREAREKAERAASSQQKFCGMDCAGQEGKPPDLQCVVCLCLFHPACVNIISLRPTMFVCAVSDSSSAQAIDRHTQGSCAVQLTMSVIVI